MSSVKALEARVDDNFQDLKGTVDAIHRVQAVIEFSMDGVILQANKNFLDTMGYQIDEIKGKPHRLFCEESYVNSTEYRQFWERLGRVLKVGPKS